MIIGRGLRCVSERVLISRERGVANVAEAAAGEFTRGRPEGFGGFQQNAEDDGAVFVGETGFDDEAAEHDFSVGICFAFSHAELGELAFKPQEETAAA